MSRSSDLLVALAAELPGRPAVVRNAELRPVGGAHHHDLLVVEQGAEEPVAWLKMHFEGERLILHEVWVDRAYRNKGCATWLLEVAKVFAVRLGPGYVMGLVRPFGDAEPTVDELLGFYGRRGFVVVERQDDEPIIRWDPS